MLTMDQAIEKHFDELVQGFIFVVAPSPCTLCRKISELRAGVCFECKDLIGITDDLKECFELKNSLNRWPMVWRVGNPI